MVEAEQLPVTRQRNTELISYTRFGKWTSPEVAVLLAVGLLTTDSFRQSTFPTLPCFGKCERPSMRARPGRP